MPVTAALINRLEAEIPGYNKRPLTLQDLGIIAEVEGFRLVKTPMNVDGMSIPAESGHPRTVAVNSRLMAGHRDFVGWHEYFHKLHPNKIAYYRRGRYYESSNEIEASGLAAVAIMPTPMLIEIGRDVGRLDVDVLRYHFEIPIHLARFRLNVLDGYQDLLRAREGLV